MPGKSDTIPKRSSINVEDLLPGALRMSWNWLRPGISVSYTLVHPKYTATQNSTPNPKPTGETSTPSAHAPATTKANAPWIALCYAYCEQYNVDVKIARIFNAYGPRLRADDGRVISSFIASALAGEAIKITGDGTATRSFQYVSDCVEGLYALMNSGYREGPVNIGNDTEITIQRLAELTVDLVSQMSGQDRVPITYHPLPVDDVNVRRPDITLAKSKLGWAPVVELEDGLRKTVEWYMHDS